MGIIERKKSRSWKIPEDDPGSIYETICGPWFDNVSIRKIADLIEYSPTTVYLYFKDKDEIFYDLHNIGSQKLQEVNENLE